MWTKDAQVRAKLMVIVCVIVLFCAASTVQATQIGGAIGSDTTFTLAGSPHVLTSYVEA